MADPLDVAPDSPAKVVLDVWEEIFNQHNLDAADRLVAEDYAQNTEGVPGGREGFKAAFSMYLEMSPDLHVEPKSIVTVDENIVIIRGKVYMDNPPQGYTSPIEVVDIFRVRNGMIQEHWEV